MEITTCLNTFAIYFCDAIFSGPLIDLDSLDLKSDHITLKLTYKIGNMILEGKLKVASLQKNLNPQIFSMMHCLYIDRSSQLTPEEWVLKPKPNTSNVIVNKNSNISSSQVDFVGDSAQGEELEQEAGPVKAKKRKAGGVNLFAKKVWFLYPGFLYSIYFSPQFVFLALVYSIVVQSLCKRSCEYYFGVINFTTLHFFQ